MEITKEKAMKKVCPMLNKGINGTDFAQKCITEECIAWMWCSKSTAKSAKGKCLLMEGK